MRPTCRQCKRSPCAVNYQYKGKTYYRKLCVACDAAKKQGKSEESQALTSSGYKKRNECDRCHFKAKHPNQLSIVFLDGNRLNVSRQNLRTYCANCITEIAALGSDKGGLLADY